MHADLSPALLQSIAGLRGWRTKRLSDLAAEIRFYPRVAGMIEKPCPISLICLGGKQLVAVQTVKTAH